MPEKAKTHHLSATTNGNRETERQRRQRRGSRPYDRAKWKHLRKTILARDPICVMCLAERRTESSTCVDHIVALKDGGTDHKDNLRGLCDSHHNRKTATQDGGFGR